MSLMMWPILGSLALAVVAGPLGALLLWRRMAYFGDSLAHASLFGVSLALMTHLPMAPLVIMLCLLMALVLSRLMESSQHGNDTWLAIMAYGGLSLAMLTNAALTGDSHAHGLEDYLFGDLNEVTAPAALTVMVGAVVVLVVLKRTWRGLVLQSIDEELAALAGWPVKRLRTGLLLMLAVVVAAGAKLMGVLLISALLVIPAAAARFGAHSPNAMALQGTVIALLSVSLGLTASTVTGWPGAPWVVISALALLLLRAAWHHRGKAKTAPKG